MASLHIIYASTSGNTQYVIETVKEHLSQADKNLEVTVQRAEEAEAEDLKKGDILLLASATWNYDAVEGYLNMHMREFLDKRCKDVDIEGRQIAMITLGDDRYYYTGRATERFMQFIMQKKAKSCTMPLLIINEPYGQEEKITKWADKLLECFNS